jgi:hypothetical protein
MGSVLLQLKNSTLEELVVLKLGSYVWKKRIDKFGYFVVCLAVEEDPENQFDEPGKISQSWLRPIDYRDIVGRAYQLWGNASLKLKGNVHQVSVQRVLVHVSEKRSMINEDTHLRTGLKR